MADIIVPQPGDPISSALGQSVAEAINALQRTAGGVLGQAHCIKGGLSGLYANTGNSATITWDGAPLPAVPSWVWANAVSNGYNAAVGLSQTADNLVVRGWNPSAVNQASLSLVGFGWYTQGTMAEEKPVPEAQIRGACLTPTCPQRGKVMNMTADLNLTEWLGAFCGTCGEAIDWVAI